MRNLRRTLLRLMRLFRRKNLVSPLSSHGRIFSTELWFWCNFWRQTTQGWFLGGCHWLSPRVSLQRGLVLQVYLCVKMYILTYNIQITKHSLTASTTLVKKTYRSSWFTVQVLMMSHSITFHSVYFELSNVTKRETIEGTRASQSSSVFSQCLIWFPRKKSQKIAINRNKSIRLIAICSQMKKSIKTNQ